MNKEELVQEVAKKAKVTQKEAVEVLNGFIETVQKSVSKGQKVTLVGFGTFEARKRAARTGRNPQTGKEIKIAAKTVPAFSAGKNSKNLLTKNKFFNNLKKRLFVLSGGAFCCLFKNFPHFLKNGGKSKN